ncbi:hypothetical protein [Mycobacterium deserti]|uniref:Uncharacterized protein n=1 Tax=Mycobacterium deserti TaxID=2978347 RepID=A0ABT2M9Q9_9MYCO|nr:hypothetical protein [Mycobacterium deserti]MCT7659002.1 hypothetical protein [Mycobacterium deserti]
MAFLVVIGVTAAVAISVTKDGADNDPNPTANDFGLASADDKGPVNIITVDPTCSAWRSINSTFVDAQEKGWNKRDPAVPRSAWTAEQRTYYEEVARAASQAADQTVALIRTTPHRIMREFYEQFVAYSRAYSESIADYTAADDNLAGVVTSTGTVLVDICAAIEWGSAASRAPLVSAIRPPSSFAPTTNPQDPHRFLASPDSTCPDWIALVDRFDADTRAWQALDPNVRAADWNAEQRAVIRGVTPVMRTSAEAMEALGRQSSNPWIEDFAATAAQYRRAYATALESYMSADFYLAEIAARAASTIYAACKAAEG